MWIFMVILSDQKRATETRSSVVNEDAWPPLSAQQLLSKLIANSSIIRHPDDPIADILWGLPEALQDKFKSLRSWQE